MRGVLLAIVATALLAAVAPAGQAAGTKGLTIYAVATRAQFTNHADDRVRGSGSNPFNVDVKHLPTPKTTGKGPQAGDEALFTFKLYSDAAFKHQIGTAVYDCTVNFGHMALCKADFELHNGALFASGPTNFDSTTFTLAVSGGTGSYLGTRGQVSSTPNRDNAHRLTFLLR